MTNADPYPGPVYGKSSSPTVSDQGGPPHTSARSASANAAGSGGVISLPYDPATGMVTGTDGNSYQLGFNGPLAPIFGSDSWEWLLIAPTMR